VSNVGARIPTESWPLQREAARAGVYAVLNVNKFLGPLVTGAGHRLMPLPPHL